MTTDNRLPALNPRSPSPFPFPAPAPVPILNFFYLSLFL